LLLEVDNALCVADHAMSRETIVVGDERAQFLYRSGIESRNVYYGSVDHYFSDAVALVFARDQNRPSGILTLFIYVLATKIDRQCTCLFLILINLS
jgi:hypothetical protein